MLEQLKPRILPKEWFLIAEQGQELPASILAQIGIYDSVLIREIPRGFLGNDTSLPKVAWYKNGERYIVPGRESEQAA
jgi:hypothetical protein